MHFTSQIKIWIKTKDSEKFMPYQQTQSDLDFFLNLTIALYKYLNKLQIWVETQDSEKFMSCQQTHNE